MKNKDVVNVKQNNHAFTLLELIIVITILIILWIIVYISLNKYSEQTRDSARISDLSSIKTSLELFQIDSSKYPLPTNSIDITYSWALVWKQWTIWESLVKNIDKLDKIPIDPLTNSQYTYSTTYARNEYEIAWLFEWDLIAYNPFNTSIKLGNELLQVNAWNVEARAYVTWNYNWLMNKTVSWATCYVLSLPTIIASDIETSNKLEDIIENNRLVYNWYNNLPASYKNSKFNVLWWFDFNPNNLLSYNWMCTDLEESVWERIKVIYNLQKSYSWTIIDKRNEWWTGTIITDLFNIDIIWNISWSDWWWYGELSLTWITTNSWWLTINTSNRVLVDQLTRNIKLSNTTVVKTYDPPVRSCGIKYFNIWTDVTELQLAKYHDQWNNLDSNTRKWSRIAAANRYCSIYWCNSNIQNCVWVQAWRWYNGWWTYLESTNQIMCVWWSELKDWEFRVLSSWAMNVWDIPVTDLACKTECTNTWFDNWVSVERNNTNIWCSCWDNCDKVISTNNCATQPSYTNATFTTWTPTQSNQVWQNTNSWNACYYQCDSGYNWNGSSCQAIIINPCNTGLLTWNWWDWSSAVNAIYISNATQFQDINSTWLNKYYLQIADIDMTWVSSFTPIWNTTTNFTWNYNWNGCTISNLNINTPTIDYVWVFWYIWIWSTIKDLTFDNITLTWKDFVWPIANSYWSLANKANITNVLTTNSNITWNGYVWWVLWYSIYWILTNTETQNSNISWTTNYAWWVVWYGWSNTIINTDVLNTNVTWLNYVWWIIWSTSSSSITYNTVTWWNIWWVTSVWWMIWYTNSDPSISNNVSKVSNVTRTSWSNASIWRVYGQSSWSTTLNNGGSSGMTFNNSWYIFPNHSPSHNLKDWSDF